MTIDNNTTIRELAAALAEKKISAVELTEHFLQIIEQKEGTINALITITPDDALTAAKKTDEKIRKGEKLSPLAGIPFVLKDNISTKGIRTTCASRILEEYVPAFSATVAKKLNEQDAVLLGKTNLDEFAMGSTTESSYFGATKNPLDTTLVPGGSSGGSAAAVAAGEAVFALGSDTGGSIAQPSAFCGVTGVRPTYGTVSRQGIVAYASSLDQAGPIARSVEDAAFVLSAIAGHDPFESTSLRQKPPAYFSRFGRGVKGLTIGIADEFFGAGLDDIIRDAVQNAARELEKAGAILKKVFLPCVKYALPAYYILSSAEASSNLARFDGIHYGFQAEGVKDVEDVYFQTRTEGFGEEVKRRIMLGTFALSSGYYDAYYKKAQQVRTIMANELINVFKTVDLLIAPVSPVMPWKLGEKVTDPVKRYLNDIYTVPVSMAGLPALSLPVAKTDAGLSISAQIFGPRFSEPVLFQAGETIEEVCQ